MYLDFLFEMFSDYECVCSLATGASPERNSPATTPELPRLYMRSRSENDACLLSNRTSRRSQLSSEYIDNVKSHQLLPFG